MSGNEEKTAVESDDFDFLESVDDDFSTDEFVDGQTVMEADNDCGDSCTI